MPITHPFLIRIFIAPKERTGLYSKSQEEWFGLGETSLGNALRRAQKHVQADPTRVLAPHARAEVFVACCLCPRAKDGSELSPFVAADRRKLKKCVGCHGTGFAAFVPVDLDDAGERAARDWW